MKKVDFLKDTFLFSDLLNAEIESILSEIAFEVKEYRRGELIFSPSDYEKKLGFVICGHCDVLRTNHDGASVYLNTLDRGDSFGILAALSSSEYPTTIIAKSATQVLFLTREALLYLIKKYNAIALNVINFLTSKIAFLNMKVATFSAESVEAKLSQYLLSELRERRAPELAFNVQRCSKAINAGRASVYRALEAMQAKGIIKMETKKITIIDPKGLERNSK